MIFSSGVCEHLRAAGRVGVGIVPITHNRKNASTAVSCCLRCAVGFVLIDSKLQCGLHLGVCGFHRNLG